MTKTAASFDRGDIIWIDFNPSAGREIVKRRPALVLSAKRFNEVVGLALVAPITSTQRGLPFDVDLLPGSKTTGVVKIEQIRTLDLKARNAEFIEKIPTNLLDQCLGKARAILG